MVNKKELGLLGESLVKRFFEEKGYEFIERNYFKKIGEIDLIFKKDNNIYFVEVKSGEKGNIDPTEHLNKEKIGKFEKIVSFYLKEKKLEFFINKYGNKEKIKYFLWAAIVKINKKKKEAEIKIIKDLNFE